MTEQFGAGPKLDENLDFEIGPTGDIEYVNGQEELEKDLAMQMVFTLQRFLGHPPSGNIDAKVIDVASKVATADVRVTRVDRERSSVEWADNRRRIIVKLVVVVGDETYDLVFNI